MKLQTSARLAGGDKEQGKWIGAVAISSSRHPAIVIGIVLLTTLVLGAGIPLIDTDVDVADVLPRGNPHTEAAKNVTARFKSAYTQQASVNFFTNQEGWARDNAILPYRNDLTVQRYDLGPDNITDEVYVRAQEEFFQYVAAASGGTIRAGVGVPGFYKLINWTIAGGEDAPAGAFALPGYSQPDEAAKYDVVHATVRATIGDTIVDAVIDPTYDQMTLLLLVDPKEELSSRDIGQVYINALDAYNAAAERGELKWTVFGPDNPPLFIVDSPVANAHGSTLTQEDLARLAPLVAGFLFVTLFIAFRNIRGVIISGATLVASVIWTYGIMGYMGIPLNTLNLTIVPLILGVGIDYTVHMVNEFLEHKSNGLSDQEAFRVTGHRAGFAMLIATLTTIIGLIVMIASPSLLMAQLGFLSALAIAFTYLLTITFIPAALSLIRNTDALGASFKPSALMPAWGANISAHKAVWGGVIVLITVATLVNTGNLQKEAFGDPGSNFPPDDPLRIQHETSLTGFYNTPEPEFKTNILVFEGDITDYDTHVYIRELAKNLAAKPTVNPTTLRNIVIGLESWLTIRDGGVSAVQALAFQDLFGRTDNAAFDTYPKTKAEIEAVIDDAWASPFRETISLFLDYPGNTITTMTFAVSSRTFIDAEEAWNDVMEAIDETSAFKPNDVTVAFVGNTATNYLFIEEELPWLNYMSIVASLTAVLLMAYFTRDLKATFVVALLMAVTTIWFLGVLPWMGIGLAITLMLPMVFIFNIGTDYAVHLVWNLKQVPDPREVFANVGKAILFSAITTIGAFAFFIPIRNVAMQKTMLATTVAITVIFFATIIIVALFYRIPSRVEAAAREEAETSLEFESEPVPLASRSPPAPVPRATARRDI